VLISVEVKNDKGRIEKWMAEANSPNVLSRHGWSKGNHQAGGPDHCDW